MEIAHVIFTNNIERLSKLITRDNVNECIYVNVGNDEYIKKTPLMYAISHGRYGMIKLLIERGTNVNLGCMIAGNYGLLPIQIGSLYSESSYFPIFKLLIKSGANPCINFKGHINHNCVLRASDRFNLKVVKYLSKKFYKDDHETLLMCLAKATSRFKSRIIFIKLKDRIRFVKYLISELRRLNCPQDVINEELTRLPEKYQCLFMNNIVDEGDKSYVLY